MKTLKTRPGSIDLDSFGKAMGQLDLSSIPEHNRRRAVMDHLLAIQEDTIEDREIAAQINVSRRILAAKGRLKP